MIIREQGDPPGTYRAESQPARLGLLSLQAAFVSPPLMRYPMIWETPTYTDLRFGFEVTMYIYNR